MVEKALLVLHCGEGENGAFVSRRMRRIWDGRILSGRAEGALVLKKRACLRSKRLF